MDTLHFCSRVTEMGSFVPSFHPSKNWSLATDFVRAFWWGLLSPITCALMVTHFSKFSSWDPLKSVGFIFMSRLYTSWSRFLVFESVNASIVSLVVFLLITRVVGSRWSGFSVTSSDSILSWVPCSPSANFQWVSSSSCLKTKVAQHPVPRRLCVCYLLP